MSKWYGKVNDWEGETFISVRCPKCHSTDIARMGYPLVVKPRAKVLLNYSQLLRCRTCNYGEIKIEYTTPKKRVVRYKVVK